MASVPRQIVVEARTAKVTVLEPALQVVITSEVAMHEHLVVEAELAETKRFYA